MIKVYTITSLYSDTPLAEVRTDGVNLDWVVDNTKGKISIISGNSLEKLKQVIDQSSHLSLNQSTGSTLGILRYFLKSGDVVEVTTDGKTAQLNGKLMTESEKNGLMSAIFNGKVEVKQKADIKQPLQLISTPERRVESPKKKVISPIYSEQVKKAGKKQDEIDSLNNKKRDSRVNAIGFEDSHCPQMGRELLLLLKYGDDDE